MSTDKAIDSPLPDTYCIAILATDHTDRMFLSLDQYRNRLSWSRLYRPGLVYPTLAAAQETIQEILDNKHPHLTDAGANIDLSSLRILATQILFRSGV